MQLYKIAMKTLIPNESYRFQEICLRVLSLCRSNCRKDGVCVHSPLIKLGLEYDMYYLSNTLLNLYAKCFGIEQARHFFDEIPQRDVVSWTPILSTHVRRDITIKLLRFLG
ncbi:hypothetical protein QN277_011084 [Acacia crassicarpa]|uniref:Pentatricopeptide repeat-containing protein n=1 Tax=Acacia crassicarpa TaxID=499986 RepID=A0AAE1MY48_9FABA|nr:hypothetical protein QN277_011084 [Acacia crassicarpa]